MFGLFGKKKKKKNVMRRTPAQKKEQAIGVLNKLKMKYKTDEARIEHLSQEIKRLKLLLLQEKKKKRPDKRVIKRHFTTWKLKEKQLDTYDNYLISTQKQIDSIETQMGAADAVDLMKESSTFIKANQPNIEEVEDVTSDLQELTEDLDEVNNLIAEHGNTGIDEDDMMGELDDMLEDMTDEEEEDLNIDLPEPQQAVKNPDLPAVPTSNLPELATPAAQTASAAAAAPRRVAVAVGAGGAGKPAAADDDEAELLAMFGD